MNRRPHLLFLVQQLELGGAQRAIVTLASQLRDDFRVTVGYFFGADTFRPHLERIDVPVIELSGSRRLSKNVKGVARAISTLEPDIINAHDPWSAVLARPVAAVRGVPFVTTLQQVTSSFRAPVAIADRLTSATMESGTVCISEEVERSWLDSRLRWMLDRTPRAVIPNPVDLGRIEEALAADPLAKRRELGIPDDARLIANVGRYVPQKAQDSLIDALPTILASEPEAWLVLVGHGRLEHSLRARAKASGVADRVIFAVQRTDALEIVAASDVFAFPSLFEGLGIAALEAMALGVPVVASASPPLTEFIRDGETGFLFSPGSATDLARVVAQILQDSGLREPIISRARAEVTERFSPTAVGRQYEGYLRSML